MVVKNWKCAESAQTDLEHLVRQKYPVYTKYLPMKPRFLVRFAQWLCVSEIQGYQKSEMHRMTQIDLEQLTVKSIMRILNTSPWNPIFCPFRSTTNDFQDTRSPKIGNAPNDPNLNLNT